MYYVHINNYILLKFPTLRICTKNIIVITMNLWSMRREA